MPDEVAMMALAGCALIASRVAPTLRGTVARSVKPGFKALSLPQFQVFSVQTKPMARPLLGAEG